MAGGGRSNMEIRIVGSINGKDEANMIKSITKVFVVESRIKTMMHDEDSVSFKNVILE